MKHRVVRRPRPRETIGSKRRRTGRSTHQYSLLGSPGVYTVGYQQA